LKAKDWPIFCARQLQKEKLNYNKKGSRRRKNHHLALGYYGLAKMQTSAPSKECGGCSIQSGECVAECTAEGVH
jgi:hypothetical protein